MTKPPNWRTHSSTQWPHWSPGHTLPAALWAEIDIVTLATTSYYRKSVICVVAIKTADLFWYLRSSLIALFLDPLRLNHIKYPKFIDNIVITTLYVFVLLFSLWLPRIEILSAQNSLPSICATWNDSKYIVQFSKTYLCWLLIKFLRWIVKRVKLTNLN